jgi:DNA-binding LacI/PurR family transcriptional regulator
MSPSHPSLGVIARRLDVSLMTVSRALRGKKGVGDDLREQIIKVAEEIGYRCDPTVSHVMASLRRSMRPSYRETIAFVRTHLMSADRLMIEGAKAQADRLGYKLEVFHPWEQGLTGRGMSRVLDARGIRGVLLGPNSSVTHPRYWLEWDKFAVVLLGSSLINQGLHRVQFDHYGAAFLALRKLKHAGYKRVGLVINRSFHERAWHRQVSAYQAYVGLPGAERDRLMFFVDADQGLSRFHQWVAEERPDALICDEEGRYDWVRQNPDVNVREIGVVSLNVYAPDSPVSGIRQHEDAIGREAVNVLATQLSGGELGLQTLPHTLFVPGTWHGGSSIRRFRGLAGASV